MQATGTLDESGLRGLLESAQGERATGTLTVRDAGTGACTLYFLFGHLFHAVGDGVQGDAAVVRALNWSGASYEFDAKAKLPADETVKGSLGDLVTAAELARPEPDEKAPEPAPAPEAPPEPEPEAQSAPEPEPQPEPEPKPAPPSRTGSASRPPREEPPSPRRGVKHRPEPSHGREPFPVPSGTMIYDSLKTSFVDFPRLITTLEREGYTGYVRLLTDDAAGLILFRDGAALECAYDAGEDPTVALGRSALTQFNEAVTQGHGVLDVVALSGELVDGLFELMVAKPMYSDLFASWVDTPALLRFLEEKRLDGSVMVRSGSGIGVIILTAGTMSGAYTSESRDISNTADLVLALCSDPAAVIEVKAADGSGHQPLDVDGVVGSGRKPGSSSAAPAAPAAPEPAPAPPAAAAPASTAAWEPQPEPAPAAPAAPAPAGPSTGAWEVAGPEAATTTQTLSTQPLVAQQVVPAPEPQPEPAPAPAPDANVDWEAVVADLQQATEDALGTRARKVKDVIGAAERSRAGLESAIDQVPTISILFVDSARLETLAAELRTRLNRHLA